MMMLFPAKAAWAADFQGPVVTGSSTPPPSYCAKLWQGIRSVLLECSYGLDAAGHYVVEGGLRMAETATRRSDRVSMAIPLETLGTDVSGEYFVQRAATVILSRYGAAILVNRRLAPTQEMVIRHLEANREAECRVVGQIGQREGGYVYGIAFLDQGVDFWGIAFPPAAPAEEAVGRALLQCGCCGNRQVTYLNEFDLEVFQANRIITLYCQRCRDTTLWKAAEYEARSKDVTAPVRSAGESDAGPEVPNVRHVQEEPRTENERKHFRVRTSITACVRHAGFEDEVADSENVSRGGFCFRSRRTYVLGSSVDVALPYTAGSGNIFISARIVRVRALHADEKSEYGVSYGHVS